MYVFSLALPCTKINIFFLPEMIKASPFINKFERKNSRGSVFGLFMAAVYQSAMTVSGTRWHLLSSDVVLINAVFCEHNIAGINESKLSFTESLVVCTDQRWRLLIRWWQLLFRPTFYETKISLHNPFNILHIYRISWTNKYKYLSMECNSSV